MPISIPDINIDESLNQYKEAVCEQYANARLLQFVEEVQSEQRTIDIEDIYVDLKCEPFSARGNSLYASGNAALCSQCLIVSNDQRTDRRKLLNMVILGLPGAGKTTLLKYLLKKYSQQPQVVPIYLELKNEVDTEFCDVLEKGSKVLFPDLQNFIASYMSNKGFDGDSLSGEISKQLHSKKYEFIFFCDGLDEISPQQYKQLSAVVNKASTFVGCYFIISSRQIGFYTSDYCEKFKLYCLMDFDENAQREYIDKYYKILDNEALTSRKVALLEIMNRKSDSVILKLAKSPILLSLLCVTPNIKNIRSKAELFSNAIEVLLKNRNIVQQEDLDLFVNFLKELAVVFFKLDKAECFDHSELEFYANRFFCSQGDSESCALLKSKYLSCGLFDKSERANAYKFAHRTIWEYLVAAGMINRDPNEIYSRANTGVWHEPIKMYVSLLGQKSPSKIFETIQKIWNENKSLALNCMNEFDPFPTDILNKLYGGLSRREKLSLVTTLRNSYINYNGSFRNPIINTIRETLTLMHSIEKDCEVIFAYLEFLEEFKEETAFNDLLHNFLQLDTLKQRQDILRMYGLEFVDLKSGTFNMGRNKISTRNMAPSEINDIIIIDDYEVPAHKVKIDHDFQISRTLVTNRMYFESGFPYADSSHLGNPYSSEPDQPVNFVNWYEAMVFAKWFGCTLPSEAEWEYACRGGCENNDFMTNHISELQKILDEKVNYTGDKTNKTRSVIPINDTYANSIGLIDMLGNLREWCLDWFSEDFYSKCIVDSYPTYQDDIIDKHEVSYYWTIDASGEMIPVLVLDTTDQSSFAIFTFDDEGCCISPVQTHVDKIEAKSLRGGCFDWSIANLRPTYRNHNPANNIYKVNGFRLLKKENK